MLQCYDRRAFPEEYLAAHRSGRRCASDAFGPFRVLHQIGAGALGPVFRAYDPEQDRLVAVKLFRLDLSPERVPSARRRTRAAHRRGSRPPGDCGADCHRPRRCLRVSSPRTSSPPTRSTSSSASSDRCRWPTRRAWPAQLAGALDFAAGGGRLSRRAAPARRAAGVRRRAADRVGRRPGARRGRRSARRCVGPTPRRSGWPASPGIAGPTCSASARCVVEMLTGRRLIGNRGTRRRRRSPDVPGARPAALRARVRQGACRPARRSLSDGTGVRRRGQEVSPARPTPSGRRDDVSLAAPPDRPVTRRLACPSDEPVTWRRRRCRCRATCLPIDAVEPTLGGCARADVAPALPGLDPSLERRSRPAWPPVVRQTLGFARERGRSRPTRRSRSIGMTVRCGASASHVRAPSVAPAPADRTGREPAAPSPRADSAQARHSRRSGR